MKKKPRISVIVPAYNGEKFIHNCLSSVFNQKTKRQFFDETIKNQGVVLPDNVDMVIRLHNLNLDKVLFNNKYQVYSSFRRVKKHPLDIAYPDSYQL